jgi:hypothetical protein
MSDPVTIGFLAAEALSIAAKAALKGAVGEAVKDAYSQLKAKIVLWAGGDVEALEKAPDAEKRKALIAEEIDKQPENELAAVKVLATTLLDELQRGKGSNPVGIDIGRLEAMRVQLAEISVFAGTGIRIGEVKTPGEFKVEKLIVGKPLGKAKR